MTKIAAIDLVKKSTLLKKFPIHIILRRFLVETEAISLFYILSFFIRDILSRMDKTVAIPPQQ